MRGSGDVAGDRALDKPVMVDDLVQCRTLRGIRSKDMLDKLLDKSRDDPVGRELVLVIADPSGRRLVKAVLDMCHFSYL